MLIHYSSLLICTNEHFTESRRVWRYKRGNQTQLTEGGEKIQWTKERSTKHTHKAKDQIITESNISKQPSSTLKYGV